MISGRFRARKILRKIEIQQEPRISAFSSYKGATCIDYNHLKVKRFINFNFSKQINRMGWSALPWFNLRHIEKIAYIKKLRHYDILNVL